MIDCSELLLGPWLAADGSTCRKVLNAANDTIGSIRRSAPKWTWACRPRFEIREGDDHSLLFSVSPRSWAPRRWVVHDADEQLVGALIRRSRQQPIQALNRAGLPLGDLSWLAAMTAAKAVSPQGTWLCDIDRHADGTRICFAPGTDPFSRMVLLAATLVAGI
jgi:hypothetical protein